jgi:DNA-binding LacI/PurR family transcriptional regulator
LMKARRKRDRSAEHGTALCYLTAWPKRDGWKSFTPQFFPAAEARAKALGYRLEPFWLMEPNLTPERLAKILLNRGIFGVLVSPVPYAMAGVEFPWELFSTVIIGANCRRPAANRVAYNHFEDASLGFRQVSALGYKRIGLVDVTPPTRDFTVSAKRRLGGYLSEQVQLPKARRLSPYHDVEVGPVGLDEWREAQRPDAILTMRYKDVRRWLEAGGLRVPEDVAVFDLEKQRADDPWPGVYHDTQHVGVHAVNLLVSGLGLNERGLPEEPCESLISGVWSPEGARR